MLFKYQWLSLVLGIALHAQPGFGSTASTENNPRTFRKILFVCTGNYYRSRFAEAVFNFYFGGGKTNWTAISRGFRPDTLTVEQRKTHASVHTFSKLKELGIPLSFIDGTPTFITAKDLADSDYIVALHRKEHEPMFVEKFPKFNLKKVEFWDVPDGKEILPSEALQRVYERTRALGTKLTAPTL